MKSTWLEVAAAYLTLQSMVVKCSLNSSLIAFQSLERSRDCSLTQNDETLNNCANRLLRDSAETYFDYQNYRYHRRFRVWKNPFCPRFATAFAGSILVSVSGSGCRGFLLS